MYVFWERWSKHIPLWTAVEYFQASRLEREKRGKKTRKSALRQTTCIFVLIEESWEPRARSPDKLP